MLPILRIDGFSCYDGVLRTNVKFMSIPAENGVVPDVSVETLRDMPKVQKVPKELKSFVGIDYERRVAMYHFELFIAKLSVFSPEERQKIAAKILLESI